jgi:cell division protein FtsI/penicillin-binding protein 2
MMALVLLAAATLYEQSLARVLEQAFTEPDVSYLVIDVPTRRLIALRWDLPERPVPLGSLVKLFTAFAYGERHGFEYPKYVCQGCWLPRGHGRLGIEEAIAHSCNAYFLALASEEVAPVARRSGIEEPPARASPSTLIGLGDGWKIAPLAVTRAYCDLLERPELRRGMALSTQVGTASQLGIPALAKTGTAVCAHPRKGPADGYVVALYPPEAPRLALLVRVHGTTGAQAAAVAGRMLRLIAVNK